MSPGVTMDARLRGLLLVLHGLLLAPLLLLGLMAFEMGPGVGILVLLPAILCGWGVLLGALRRRVGFALLVVVDVALGAYGTWILIATWAKADGATVAGAVILLLSGALAAASARQWRMR